jgi:hypothetical protein
MAYNPPPPASPTYNAPVAGPTPIQSPLTEAERVAGLSIWEALDCRKFDISPKQYLALIDASATTASDLSAEEAKFCEQWGMSTGILSASKKAVKVTQSERDIAETMGQPPTYAIGAKARLLARRVSDSVKSRGWIDKFKPKAK